ncbi:MAG: MBL fold metallo-hydrolase [Deltaproteobacteria bacterium]|nr:MBL fold metallo-hydrolase [Deltaproteobacteria bacterium]
MFDFTKGAIKFIRGGRYPFCHSLLVDDQIRMIIDASSDKDKLQSIKDQGPVDYLITSHAHEDHIVFNYLFPESKFWAHPSDAPFLADLESLIDCYGDMSEEDKKRWREFLQNDCHYVPRKVDLFLEEGTIMDLGKVRMQIIHAPGHTKGHCAFYFIQEKIMFTADLDLTKAGPYYGDRGSDIEETIQSLKRLKTFEVETYLTSHGKGIFDGDPANIDRYLEIIYLREGKLIEFLKTGPKTLEQVVKEGIIYGQSPNALGAWDLTLTEKIMMAKHLGRLARIGRVRQEGEFFILVA